LAKDLTKVKICQKFFGWATFLKDAAYFFRYFCGKEYCDLEI